MQRALAQDATASCAGPVVEAIRLPLPALREWKLAVHGAVGAWIELQEHGQDLQLDVAPATIEGEIGLPPRYGTTLLDVPGNATITVRRIEPGFPRGEWSFVLHCAGSRDDGMRRDWLRDLSKAVIGIRPGDPASVASSIETIRRLEHAAVDARTRALALHAIAQGLLMLDASANAAIGFGRAEDAWLAAGQKAQAMAARVGRVEDLRRAGRYNDVLSLVPKPSAATDSSSYFAVRVVNSRCLSLRDLGRSEEARECYEWTLPRMDDLGERIEFVNTLQNYAVIQAELGRPAEAEQLARKALQLADGPNADIVRGRIQLLLADIALSKADPAAGISSVNDAIRSFTRSGNQRWQANALAVLATIYREIGAHEEAYEAIAEAFSRLRAKDAPARVAYALRVLSDIDLASGRRDDARNRLEEALRLHDSLRMSTESATDRARLVRLRADEGSTAAPDSAVVDERALDDAARVTMAFARIRIALGIRDAESAWHGLESLKNARLALVDRIAWARMRADYRDLVGQSSDADAELVAAYSTLSATARRTDNAILRQLIAGQGDALRRKAFERILRAHELQAQAPDTAALVRWLIPDDAGRVAAPMAKARSSSEFDEAVAADLLGDALSTVDRRRAQERAQRQLLSLLAEREPSRRAPDSVQSGPASLRHLLAPGMLLLAHIEGDERSALLLIDPEGSSIAMTAPVAELRADASRLKRLLASVDSSSADIGEAARRLSFDLFRNMPASRPPDRLLVLAGTLTSDIPWSMLEWPGSGGILLETTATELVRPGAQVMQRVDPVVHVLIASQRSVPEGGLARLAIAEAAPALVGRALSQAHRFVVSDYATRDDVLAALAERNAWVHVAAHGITRPNRIGYSGLWLEPRTGSVPDFLSGLDLLGGEVNAELVVLDACQLGEHGEAINSSVNFADAISQAGARHVVAATWPVSDSASAVWTPAFWSTLSKGVAPDAALALREAQLAVRSRRMFRHPFYWAGWQVQSRAPTTTATN